MCANIQLIVLQLLAILCLKTAIGSEIGVPVLLWQRRTEPESRSPLEDSRSTVTQIDAEVLADDYIGKTETVVAFVQKQLSLEQFTAEDETKLTAVKKLFTDASIEPTLLIDVLNPTQALASKHFRSEQWNQIHVRNGDKVTIELPKDSLVDNNELLAQLIAEIQKNVSKNALFLLTGHENQFQSIDLEVEVENSIPLERSRRDTEDQSEEDYSGGFNDTNLLAFQDCLFMYTTKISLWIYNETTGYSEFLADYYDFGNDTKRTVNANKTQCWEVTNATESGQIEQLEPAILDISFYHNETTIDLNLVIDSAYANNKTGFWSLRNTTKVTLTFDPDNQYVNKGGDFHLNQTDLSSEVGFGFSCGSLTIISGVREDKDDQIRQIMIQFSRFQLQPFRNPTNTNPDQPQRIFTESFDCETWFTLPLWMGLITLLVLFTILFMGVYFVSQINTNDRFENPKGRPLMINTAEE